MKVTVCIGSSCHVKGSKAVVDTLKNLIEKKGLSDEVELGGTFCLGKCRDGVCVDVDGVIHSVSPESAEGFFGKEIEGKLL